MGRDEFSALDARLADTKGTCIRTLLHARTQIRHSCDLIDEILADQNIEPTQRRHLGSLRIMIDGGLSLPVGSEPALDYGLALSNLRGSASIAARAIRGLLAEGNNTLTYVEGRRLELLLKHVEKAGMIGITDPGGARENGVI